MPENQRWYDKYRKELLMGFAVISALALIIGLMLAWFFGRISASTVGRVKAPSEISILGPNGTYMEQIDLSYDKSQIDKNNKITITRPFCVSSPGDTFDLYIAHTTNIADLTIKLHMAKSVEDDATGENIIKGIDSEGKPYAWELDSDIFGTGIYLNKNDKNDKIAKSDGQYHDMTFGVYNNVQQNAEPLYWYKEIGKIESQDQERMYTCNFVLELTWTEYNKETDIIYLIAKSK